jgi:phage recombination protein Bet
MTAVATIHSPSITATMADRYGMRPDAFEATLRATVFPSTGSREEFAAFLMVTKEYNLNPILREIYAFPKKGGGIQPIVSLDGWAKILNSHPAFDGLEFVDHVEKGVVTAITCRIHRKDRSHPIEATEYLAECFRGTEPWQKWPRRMLRHKALIQAARYAFGFAGIVDPDEAERFTQGRPVRTDPAELMGKLKQIVAAQPRPPEPAPPRPPIPPQPEPDEDESDDWPPNGDDDTPASGDDDHGPDADEPQEPMDELADERARLLEAAHEKAKEGSRKLKFWRARLRPEQEALIPDWSGIEKTAKQADA